MVSKLITFVQKTPLLPLPFTILSKQRFEKEILAISQRWLRPLLYSKLVACTIVQASYPCKNVLKPAQFHRDGVRIVNCTILRVWAKLRKINKQKCEEIKKSIIVKHAGCCLNRVIYLNYGYWFDKIFVYVNGILPSHFNFIKKISWKRRF